MHAASLLQQRAQAELELRRRKRGALDLVDFVPAITPRFERPEHLPVLRSFFDRLEEEEVRECSSFPPQHGKTEFILHGVARVLLRHPDWLVGYVTYEARKAYEKSRLLRDYAQHAGVRLRPDSQAVDQWNTVQGGGFIATGIGGPLTGTGLQLLIVDDPHKNRQDAESQIIRDHVHQWFTSTAMTRVHPGASVLVNHTRWHHDDLIGRLSKEVDEDGAKLWRYENVPVLNVKGQALWPSKRPLRWLKRQRAIIGEYDWASLYMGEPRPRGEGLFGPAHLYTERPAHRYRIAIGIDCAYSKKTRADWSVAVVMAATDGPDGLPIFYVLDVIRKRAKFKAWRREIADLCDAYSCYARWYIGGQEDVLVDLLEETELEALKVDESDDSTENERIAKRLSGARLNAITSGADKYIRAQGFAAAWNDGRVLIPEGAKWAPEFLSELNAFPTGRWDDQVDAGTAAFDELALVSAPLAPIVSERPNRWGDTARGF